MENPKTKICKICGLLLPLEYFTIRYQRASRRTECKMCNNLRNKTYRHKNAEKIKARKQLRKKLIKVCQAKYRLKNKDRIKEVKRIWRYKNRDIINAMAREKRKQNPERYKEYNKKSYRSNKLAHLAISKKYNQNHPEKLKELARNFHNKHKTNPQYRIRKNLRGRLYHAIRGNHKNGSAIQDLGCSIAFLKQYLESKFYPNPETGEMMTWENYGVKGWHIDHIVPLTYYGLLNFDNIKNLCHYSNLQPLWAKDNIRKGNRCQSHELSQSTR